MKQIDVLPDDVLLVIFDFYVDWRGLLYAYNSKSRLEAWQSLIHVCRRRRWRNLVLRSPCRLNLRLYSTHKTPVRATLRVWPALPLLVECNMALSSGTDNINAALEHSNRVFQVFLTLAGWQWENVLAAMQVPFPVLTLMRLWSNDEATPVIPDSFLGGSAPRLQFFELDGIPFPMLPKLLFSATHLVYLNLYGIPHPGYISPEAIAAPLSVLSNLKVLSLQFQSPQPRPDWESRSLPPLKRSVIPALRKFVFKGAIEYLEDLVAFIDGPQLKETDITFFNQIDFDCSRLSQFIPSYASVQDTR